MPNRAEKTRDITDGTEAFSHVSSRRYAPSFRRFAPLLCGVVVATATLTVAAQQLLPPATDPPVPTPPVAPVIETPDDGRAVWEPAAPGNFQPSTRPSRELPIDRIVVHDIEGSAISAVRWFQNPKARVSSHYVVDAETGRVYQMVKERDVAWHAGDGATNRRSVGIENEGFAYRPGFFNPTLYESSARLTRAIALRHNIPRDREHIIGHFEVPDTARPGKFGGRSGHTDPGPYWDWDYFMALTRNDARAVAPAATSATVVLCPGEMKEAVFTLVNTGDDPWLSDLTAQPAPDLRAQGPVYLGAWSSGGAGDGWGPKSALFGKGWVSPRFAASPSGDTAPGAEGRFVVPIHAPPGVLGSVTESFRLFKTPVAPRMPVPFGPTVAVSVRVEPWDITVPLPAEAPPGWSVKTQPNGERTFWRKAVVSAAHGASPAPTAPVASSPSSVRWQTNLPLAGEWDVYVRYAKGTGRSAQAAYQIPVDAATAPHERTERRTINQRTGGGAWRKLGRFRFAIPMTPAASPMATGVRPGAPVPAAPVTQGIVELLPSAGAPGVIVGGEARFVGPFPAASPAPTNK